MGSLDFEIQIISCNYSWIFLISVLLNRVMYLMIGAENGMKVCGFVETVQLKLGAEKAFEYDRICSGLKLVWQVLIIIKEKN